MNMRPYQHEAIEAVLADLCELDRVLCVLATGGGKTVIAGELARRFIPVGPVLFLADAKELVNQAADKIGRVCGQRAAVEMADQQAYFGDRLVVGTTQSMARRLEKWPRNAFSLIIVDEAHRNCLGAQAQKVLGHFNAAQVVGLTATPFRSDTKQLGHYFQKISCDIGLSRLVKEGYLCRIKVRSVPCPVDLSAVKRSKIGGERDLSAEDVAAAMAPHIEALAKMLAENYEGRKTVGFVPLISTSKDLAAACRGLGLRAVHVDGTDRSNMEAFTKGEADIILNSALLTTGWDFPALSCVAMMRPTESFSLFSQMVGRGTRLSDGKDHLLVLDPLWQAETMSLIRPARLVCPSEEVAAKVNSRQDEFDLFDAEAEAEAEVEVDKLKKLKEKLEANAKRSAKTVDPIEFALDLDRPDLAEYEPATDWEAAPPTRKQVEVLVKAGFAPEGWCRGKASKMLDVLSIRRSEGLATPKQVKWLKRFKTPDPLRVSFQRASQIMEARFNPSKN